MTSTIALIEPVTCEDCGEDYGSPRFPDMFIDNEAFAIIASNPPDGGLLCPNCICARLVKAGLTNVSAKFTSGPLVIPELTTLLQRCEKAEAALAEALENQQAFGDWQKEAARAFNAEALNAKLRTSLRNQFCPRPCNHRPDEFDVGDCVDAGECGCSAHNALGGIHE